MSVSRDIIERFLDAGLEPPRIRFLGATNVSANLKNLRDIIDDLDASLSDHYDGAPDSGCGWIAHAMQECDRAKVLIAGLLEADGAERRAAAAEEAYDAQREEKAMKRLGREE